MPTNDSLGRRPVSLVIFDMDGVIADTAGDHRDAWRSYLAKWNRELSDRDFHKLFGKGNREIVPLVLGDKVSGQADVDRLGEEKEAEYRRIASGRVRTYRGFFEFLDALDSMGIPMAVGSSGNRSNVDFILGELGIAHRFRCTVSSDDVKNAKPAPDIFLKAARLSGVSPEDALVIEDSFSGITAARAAGIRVAALATTHRECDLAAADLVASDFHGLADAVMPSMAAPAVSAR